MSGLIHRESCWSGDSDMLIQMEDMIDRGPVSRERFYVIADLQRQAGVAGGRFVYLCGNQEPFLLREHYGHFTYDDPQAIACELKEEIMRDDVVASYTDNERLCTNAGMLTIVKETVG